MVKFNSFEHGLHTRIRTKRLSFPLTHSACPTWENESLTWFSISQKAEQSQERRRECKKCMSEKRAFMAQHSRCQNQHRTAGVHWSQILSELRLTRLHELYSIHLSTVFPSRQFVEREKDSSVEVLSQSDGETLLVRMNAALLYDETEGDG